MSNTQRVVTQSPEPEAHVEKLMAKRSRERVRRELPPLLLMTRYQGQNREV